MKIELEGNTTENRLSWLKNILSSGVYNITFNKVNGEVRTMPCTLKETLLPAVVVKEGKEPRAQRTDSISVWCMDKQEWRSFKVMNVTDVEAVL